MAQVSGVETDAYRRPADCDALTFVPAKVNPQNAARFTELGQPAYKFIIDYLQRNNLLPPKLTPLCMEDFCSYYHDWFIKHVPAYKRLISPKM